MINMTAIVIANAMGLAAILTTVFCNRRMLTSRRTDLFYLKMIMIFTTLECLADTLVYFVNATPGGLFRAVNILGNTCLFWGNLWVPLFWFGFLHYHLYGASAGTPSRLMRSLDIVPIILTIVLVINLFYPIVFRVDQNNVYTRLGGCNLYFGFSVVYLLLSIVYYVHLRQRSETILFFPIGVFIIPIIVGSAAQWLHYGISTSWACVGIAVCGITMSIQNEVAYVDSLTGVYNRAFLFAGNPYEQMDGALMVDINRFKSINDEYGHLEGDDALVTVGGILKSVSVDYGFALRYAGDEFIIFTRNGDQETLSKVKKLVNQALDRYNNLNKKPYKLSVSFGAESFDHEQENIDAFISSIDRKMYDEKDRFYEEHREYDRRK